MPQIIPIRDLKNTAEISELCHKTNEPIFITKNGYGDMVIMSMAAYEENMFNESLRKKLAEAEKSLEDGKVYDAFESMNKLRKKYNV